MKKLFNSKKPRTRETTTFQKKNFRVPRVPSISKILPLPPPPKLHKLTSPRNRTATYAINALE